MDTDKKKQNKGNKGGLPKKSKTDQKENIPKKEKINKESIETNSMPKHLQMHIKKTKSKLKSSSRLSSYLTYRPMPSLADLEKMFEDSDEDSQTISPLNTPQTNNIFNNREPHYPPISIQDNISNDNESRVPVVFKPNLHDVEIPNSISKETFNNNNNTLIKSDEVEEIRMQMDTSINTELNENRTFSQPFDNIIDTNSSDSDKTIELNLLPDTTFCPLPSTSSDYNTIVKNDELFHKSLTASEDNNQSVNEILEESTVNLVLDNSEIESVNNRNCSARTDDDDDDCIIIESDIDSSQQESQHNNVTELRIVINEPVVDLSADNPLSVEEDIIDVDALIAENQSVVNRFQNNTTTHSSGILDVINISDNSFINETQQETALTIVVQNNTTPTPENDRLDIIFVSEALPQGSGHNTNYQRDRNAVNSVRQPSTSVNDINCMIEFTPYDVPTTYQNQSRSNPVHINSRSTPCVIVDSSFPPDSKKDLSQRFDESGGNCSTSKNFGDCPICLNDLSSKPMASTICGHVFCMECLNKSIRANNRCPTCRRVLKNKASYHPIFL